MLLSDQILIFWQGLLQQMMATAQNREVEKKLRDLGKHAKH